MKIQLIAAVVLAGALSPRADAADCADWRDVPQAWSCVSLPATAATADSNVIADKATWGRLWRASTGQDKAPQVDFASQRVTLNRAADGASVRATLASSVETPASPARDLRDAVAQDGASQRALAVAAGSFGIVGEDTQIGGGIRGGFSGIPKPSAGGLIKVALDCTPGVDCPDEQPKPRSRKAPTCTPGVDCPNEQPARKPSCTPGVDCPTSPRPRRDCTPGVDCPGDGSSSNGSTPLPPNYRPRPSGPPSRFPDYGSAQQYEQNIQVTGWWHPVESWGNYVDRVGSWSDASASGRIDRGGAEVGAQAAVYNMTLQPRQSRSVYRLHWRYVGSNCNPNNEDECLEWGIQYAYFYVGDQNNARPAFSVVVRFDDQGKAFLPWERESIGVRYANGRLSVDTNGVFRYSITRSIEDQQTGAISVDLVAGAHVPQAPEADKVSVRLERGSGAVLSVYDRRAAFYDGETLELTYVIKKDCGHWYCTDQVVAQADGRHPVGITIVGAKAATAQVSLPVGSASGTYYVSEWSFRRANSKLSNGNWQSHGKESPVRF